MAVGIRKPCCLCEARMPYTGAVSRSVLVSCGVKSEILPSPPASTILCRCSRADQAPAKQFSASDQELSLRLKHKEKLLGYVVKRRLLCELVGPAWQQTIQYLQHMLASTSGSRSPGHFGADKRLPRQRVLMSCFQGLEPFVDVAEMLLGRKDFDGGFPRLVSCQDKGCHWPGDAWRSRRSICSRRLAVRRSGPQIAASWPRTKYHPRLRRTQATWSPAPSPAVLRCRLALKLSSHKRPQLHAEAPT